MVDVRKFRDENGKVPFDEWISGLRDRRGKKRISTRVDKLSLGMEGDWKSVGEGVRELHIPEGPGYRVYYAWYGNEIIVLLCAGDKATQQQDIETAKRYWRIYYERRSIQRPL